MSLDFNDDAMEFEETGNPLFAWERILECCKTRPPTPFPDWVINYLEGVAEELVNLFPDRQKAAVEIKNALGFSGGKKHFANYRKSLEELGLGRKGTSYFKYRLYQCVVEESEKAPEKKLDDICSEVAERYFGDDPDYIYTTTVKNIYNDMNRKFKTAESVNVK